MATWADLNERQQQYLQAIDEVDQEHEKDERGQCLAREPTAPSVSLAVDRVRDVLRHPYAAEDENGLLGPLTK